MLLLLLVLLVLLSANGSMLVTVAVLQETQQQLRGCLDATLVCLQQESAGL
jgi:uncharacterized membrane protein (DUF441 family)